MFARRWLACGDQTITQPAATPRGMHNRGAMPRTAPVRGRSMPRNYNFKAPLLLN